MSFLQLKPLVLSLASTPKTLSLADIPPLILLPPAPKAPSLSLADIPPLILLPPAPKAPSLSLADIPPLILLPPAPKAPSLSLLPSSVGLTLNIVPNATSIAINGNKEVLIDADGTLVFIIRNWISADSGHQLLRKLQSEVKFERHPVNTPQGPVMQPRQIYACGDTASITTGSNSGGGDRNHNYSGLSLKLHQWVPEAKDIRDRIAKEFNFPADSCLINEYKDGKQSIGYHGDKETNGKYNNAVYTVSLGGTRDFCLKNNATGKVIKTPLNNGDLCAMLGTCQVLWKHSIPKRAKADARISLTYRCLNH